MESKCIQKKIKQTKNSSTDKWLESATKHCQIQLTVHTVSNCILEKNLLLIFRRLEQKTQLLWNKQTKTTTSISLLSNYFDCFCFPDVKPCFFNISWSFMMWKYELVYKNHKLFTIFSSMLHSFPSCWFQTCLFSAFLLSTMNCKYKPTAISKICSASLWHESRRALYEIYANKA